MAERIRTGSIKSAFVIVAIVFAAGCASSPVNTGVRPAIGTNYALQQAGLSAADQARLDAQCPLGQPKLRRADDYGITFLIARDGYALEESEKDKIPIWVCERITRHQVTGSLTKGRITFRPDPLLPAEARAVDADYSGSGFDRGHQAPLADQSREQRLRDETFFLSNVVPQNRRLNQQAWASLEARVRGWAEARDTIYAITGPLFWDPREDDPSTARGYVNYNWIGNHVSVPTHIYKIVIGRRSDRSGWEAIAFVVANKAYDRSTDWSSFIKPVAWIQKRAGIVFFPDLPSAEAASVLNAAAAMWKPE
ncbi:MAG: DNA/RNA non-specific endonuclease [Gemmatimonadota bacterium]|nr:DNA/RNA non-specific endonuclease [Gemmatimonadota bacterium]